MAAAPGLAAFLAQPRECGVEHGQRPAPLVDALRRFVRRRLRAEPLLGLREVDGQRRRAAAALLRRRAPVLAREMPLKDREQQRAEARLPPLHAREPALLSIRAKNSCTRSRASSAASPRRRTKA